MKTLRLQRADARNERQGAARCRGLERRLSFTLIELLVVIAIIAILAALLLAAIAAARERARQIAASTEVHNLEIAWTKYYETYLAWPPDLPGIADPERTRVPITGPIAVMLQGRDDQSGNRNNPQLIAFMQFNRFNDDGDPVNPWGQSATDGHGYYYVKLDNDNSGDIRAGAGEPDDPPSNAAPRVAIAWTPTKLQTRIIKSWQK